ncbi:AraC family transcriptional regulator [Ensifer sp. LCM 4579]|uniref:AraC family transcriptional regulator n=1 Tax=Ensifer sp. LCM 4579 TaxID=1848292 RepID=UPI0008D92A01|nr:AraC family transcriptional regulator [Ensifer sp. LCM 4579]OHV75344.1 AraC family transcriptional regulator [Ensifer sp. LCM 4579]
MSVTHRSPRQEMIDIIARTAVTDGHFSTFVPGLAVHRSSNVAEVSCGSYGPGLAIIVQGAKRLMLGEETLTYGASDYLVTSIDLPVSWQIVATPDEPYLSMSFQIDVRKIAEIVDRIGDAPAPLRASPRGMTVNKLTSELEDAALRLLRLLDRPADSAVLRPLLEQEVLYRLLIGPHGAKLRQMATAESYPHQVGRAVAWLTENYASPLRIEELAGRVNMSVSSLHHHFKAITAMSPLQYQKQLRLQEARRLMLQERLDAGAAGHRVGYESPSQFSREYARHFGDPPARDIGRVRRNLVGRSSGAPEMLSEG